MEKELQVNKAEMEEYERKIEEIMKHLTSAQEECTKVYASLLNVQAYRGDAYVWLYNYFFCLMGNLEKMQPMYEMAQRYVKSTSEKFFGCDTKNAEEIRKGNQ